MLMECKQKEKTITIYFKFNSNHREFHIRYYVNDQLHFKACSSKIEFE